MRRLSTLLLLAMAAGAVLIVTAGAALAAPTLPRAATGFAMNVNASGDRVAATLTGVLNPDGEATRYRFQYGSTTDYGSDTALRSVPAGTANVSVTATLTGLSAARAYHFRLVASNASGTRVGVDETFKPLATGEPSAVGQSSAILNGALDALGQPTSYYFQFGTTAAYGDSTSPRATSNNGFTGVYANVGGLQPGIAYHYRIVGHSADSYYYGVDRAFTTSAPAQSQIAVMGRLGFVSPGRWIGVQLGCFNGQTTCVGHITMSHNGTVVGQRNFSIAAETGGFQNIRLTLAGVQLLRGNGPGHLLPVDVSVVGTDGQTVSYVMKLARWVWH